ncbi:MAG: hypothetical protein C0502_03700 [Opitutus sp.]|nr:hypothetical protein [Opitutus sp.]
MNSRWLVSGLVAVVAAVVLGSAFVWGLRPEVLVTPVGRGRAVQAVTGQVEVKPEFMTKLRSEVAGRVVDSRVEVGCAVKQGETLVQLDVTGFDLEIERLQHEIAAARRRVELRSTMRVDVLNARDAVKALELQAKAGAASESELERQRRALQQLEQRVEIEESGMTLQLHNLETTLKQRQRERSRCSIIAPSDGVITSIDVRAGDLITESTPIATLMGGSPVVEARVSEENFAGVETGQDVTVRFLAYDREQFPGVVNRILPTIDPTTQRYHLHLALTMPPGRKLTPGLTGEVSIALAARPNALIVPRRSLQGDALFVAKDNRLERRRVRKGFEGLEQVEILEGVHEGEPVVVEPAETLRPGDRVRVKPVAR